MNLPSMPSIKSRPNFVIHLYMPRLSPAEFSLYLCPAKCIPSRKTWHDCRDKSDQFRTSMDITNMTWDLYIRNNGHLCGLAVFFLSGIESHSACVVKKYILDLLNVAWDNKKLCTVCTSSLFPTFPSEVPWKTFQSHPHFIFMCAPLLIDMH